ncbi:MAG TPA: Hsp20/alpha crystallin family protein [Azonexus sp.]|nr:Hsp20/alpha crystallin family protein [Azonexus sp.]
MRSGDPRLWVWAEALQLLRGAEQRQRQFFTVVTPQAVPCWEPLVDAYEEGDELKLIVALPGVSAAQIDVALEENGLVVRGQRAMPGAFHRVAIHRLEIPYGRFERRITLPPGNFQLLEQVLEDGCLALVLRRI